MSSQSPPPPSSQSPKPGEVRTYLKRLILMIIIGIIFMTGTAIWAWNTYGAKLKDAAPLPPGRPPMSPVPVKRN